MSIQCTARGFKLMTSQTRVVSHNHLTRAPALTIAIVRCGNKYKILTSDHTCELQSSKVNRENIQRKKLINLTKACRDLSSLYYTRAL